MVAMMDEMMDRRTVVMKVDEKVTS